MSIEWLDKAYMARLDLDGWIKRSFHDGPLTGYRGDLKDYNKCAEYIVQHQNVEGSLLTHDRYGCWVADHQVYETFDEGCSGKGIAVLTCLDQEIGNQVYETSAGKRSIKQANWEALKAIYKHQSHSNTNDPEKLNGTGIGGLWPQSPGWKDQEASHYLHAGRGVLTLNDNVADLNCEGMVIFMRANGDHNGQIPKRIEKCANGLRMVQKQNNGWLPEQCDKFGSPVWARGHEPDAVAPRAFSYAIYVYLMQHAISEDMRWLEYAVECAKTAEPFIKLDTFQLDGELRADFFLEQGTLRPVYGRHDKPFQKTYDRNQAKWANSTGNRSVMCGRGLKKLDYYCKVNNFVGFYELPERFRA